MPKIRFGCYLIPEQGAFYQGGSSITGYDIRTQKELPPPPYLRPEWQVIAREYGLHVTITDAIDADSIALPLITERLRQLLTCFRATNRYVCTKRWVGFWGDGRADAALVLTPNRSVELLHDVLVTALHPLGSGSAYADAYKNHPATYFTDVPSQIAKTEQFYAPYIFDEFTPHFTCVNPFTGTQQERRIVAEALTKQFDSFESMEFRTLCLVAKSDDESHYKIVEELNLHAPQ